ncbi:Calpain-7 [Phytophthora citrophthora]|uniref:Calpain-7 n=1 Tax=Phytophthora citrophthora TaxID=4793 RepID=A0AAD9GZL0_9STRA|nr:Calpain-7 [Phytophthora citrophthora]
MLYNTDMPPKKAPPKKAPSKLSAQGSSLNAPHTGHTYRQPEPVLSLPPSSSIPPLWTPNVVPTEVFPEWTDLAGLPVEYWGSAEEPFEDPLPPENLFVPYEMIKSKETITWKRPSQFLPPIVDASTIHATPPPPMPEPKPAGKKGITAVAKKGEPEPPKKPPPPKHAHVFVPKGERGPTGAGTISSSALPSTTAVDRDHPLHIPRDFQRRWSTEQIEAIQAWTKEEKRIEREQQHRERVYMGFEDAIAYIVNERPRDLLAEVDFDADDLVDDGEDDDEALTADMDVSNATSPWGVMPPPRIEIAPNAIYKPEIPHGEIIHAEMASYFRTVEELYNSSEEQTTLTTPPFLWQSIFPQDNSGHPVYNPGGKYSVKLFVFGRWRRVDVDDKLPLDADGNVVYLASSMRNEIWPCLLVKALYKVVYWLHPNALEDEGACQNTDKMCQSLVQIILALTGWKVSQWEQGTSSSSENAFQQLLQPRVVVCCTGTSKIADLVFGEIALVTDIIGDNGNTTFKLTRQGLPATISEETSGVRELMFLLVHPVLQYSDTFSREWIANLDPPLEGDEDVALFVPFETAPVHFIVVTMEEQSTGQPPGDSSSDTTQFTQLPVNLVATLTPVQPPKSYRGLDNLQKSSELMAAHLDVDPNGSVVLIEEMENKKTATSSLPAVLTLNSVVSKFITTPRKKNASIVYRVYPQKTLRYGYSLQVESDHKVTFQDAPTYWRNLSGLHVIECEGVFPVLLPRTWNILFKQTFELVPPTQEDAGLSAPELRLDLHLSEDLLTSSTHIWIVNDTTGEVKRASTLCTRIMLPVATNNENRAPIAYTLICDCIPSNVHVREGKWKLTLASDWDFAKSTTHQMKMTRFEGVYEPNKPLMCFRDLVMAPKTSIWTSFQLQFLRDGVVVNDLAAKLEVFDLAADQNLRISEISSKGGVQLLQLPVIPAAEGVQPQSDDKRGYIIQGSIDKATCIVPDNLQSLRPFRSISDRPPAAEIATKPVDENSSTEASVPDTARSFRAPSGIKWQLNCWSSEEVKLQGDNAKELQFEAIRVSWGEKSVDRNTNGAVSRLLYLGRMDHAEARMKQDNVTEEQMTKVRSRFEWIQEVKAKVASKGGAVDGSFLEEVTSNEEMLLSEEELTNNKRLLLERIGAVEADKEQRRIARALAKEERAKQLKELVRSVIDRRTVSLKKLQELKRELAAVQTQSA